MKNRKISIYLSRQIEAALATYGGHANRSGLINSLCARYVELVAAELDAIEFSNAEWRAILSANERVEAAPLVWANLHEAANLGARFGVDQAALVKRLQRLSRAQLLAIAEAAARFHSFPDLSTEAAMAKAGIKPK